MLGTDILMQQEAGGEIEENRRKKHAERDQNWSERRMGLSHWTHWKCFFFKIQPGNLQFLFPMAFLYPAEWIKVGKCCRLANKGKRIMHICGYTVLFFLSFCLCTLFWGARGAKRLFLLSVLPQLTFHGENENVSVQLDSFSSFQNAAKSRIYWCTYKIFFNDWSHAVISY